MGTKLAKASQPRRSYGAAARLAKTKAQAAARVTAAKVGAYAKARQGTFIAAGTAAALGAAEKSGIALPTVGGINPYLLYGVVGVVILPMFIKGQAGRIAEQAGGGALAVAAYKIGSGQPALAGDGGFNW